MSFEYFLLKHWCTDFYFIVWTWRQISCNTFPACKEFVRYFAFFNVSPSFKKFKAVCALNLMS